MMEADSRLDLNDSRAPAPGRHTVDCQMSVRGSRGGWARPGRSLGRNRLSVWPPWKGVIWEERVPWADGMGCLWVARSPSESGRLLSGEGVVGWYPVQSWVFSVLKTPTSPHNLQSLPPLFLLLSHVPP